MRLTPTQKLNALALRFYQEQTWAPKAGDFYTTSRADLELYRVVKVEPEVITTEYTTNEGVHSVWPAAGFLTEGFGPKRVYVPEWIINEKASADE